MNRMRKDPIWVGLRDELTKLLGVQIELVFPEAWSPQTSSWFRNVEQSAFRPDLRYSEEEILERLEMDGVLLVFVLTASIPEAFVLGYHLDEPSVETFYLDTIAVRQRGRGVGPALVSWLGKWAKKNGYQRIALDTELENEVGLRLRDFYLKMGFKQGHVDEVGNISMTLDL